MSFSTDFDVLNYSIYTFYILVIALVCFILYLILTNNEHANYSKNALITNSSPRKTKSINTKRFITRAIQKITIDYDADNNFKITSPFSKCIQYLYCLIEGGIVDATFIREFTNLILTSDKTRDYSQLYLDTMLLILNYPNEVKDVFGPGTVVNLLKHIETDLNSEASNPDILYLPMYITLNKEQIQPSEITTEKFKKYKNNIPDFKILNYTETIKSNSLNNFSSYSKIGGFGTYEQTYVEMETLNAAVPFIFTLWRNGYPYNDVIKQLAITMYKYFDEFGLYYPQVDETTNLGSSMAYILVNEMISKSTRKELPMLVTDELVTKLQSKMDNVSEIEMVKIIDYLKLICVNLKDFHVERGQYEMKNNVNLATGIISLTGKLGVNIWTPTTTKNKYLADVNVHNFFPLHINNPFEFAIIDLQNKNTEPYTGMQIENINGSYEGTVTGGLAVKDMPFALNGEKFAFGVRIVGEKPENLNSMQAYFIKTSDQLCYLDLKNPFSYSVREDNSVIYSLYTFTDSTQPLLFVDKERSSAESDTVMRIQKGTPFIIKTSYGIYKILVDADVRATLLPNGDYTSLSLRLDQPTLPTFKLKDSIGVNDYNYISMTIKMVDNIEDNSNLYLIRPIVRSYGTSVFHLENYYTKKSEFDIISPVLTYIPKAIRFYPTSFVTTNQVGFILKDLHVYAITPTSTTKLDSINNFKVNYDNQFIGSVSFPFLINWPALDPQDNKNENNNQVSAELNSLSHCHDRLDL